MPYGFELRNANNEVTLNQDSKVIALLSGNIANTGTYKLVEHMAVKGSTNSTNWTATTAYSGTGAMESKLIPASVQGTLDGISMYSADDGIVFSPILSVGVGRETTNKGSIFISSQDFNKTRIILCGFLKNPIPGYFDVYDSSGVLIWSANTMPKAVQHITSVNLNSAIPTTISLNIPTEARGNLYIVNSWGYIVANINISQSSGEWLSNYFVFSENQTKLTYWTGQFTWSDSVVFPYVRQRNNPYIPNIAHVFYVKPF